MKEEERVYTAGEICEKIQQKGFKEFHAHNLRYIEKVLSDVFEVRRDGHLNRVFSKEDVKKLETILQLKAQGFTYANIKNMLLSTSMESQLVNEVTYASFAEEGTVETEMALNYNSVDKFRELMADLLKESVEKSLSPKFEEVTKEILDLKAQNLRLKSALDKQQGDYFRQMDEKVTTWRDEEKLKRNWIQRLFS